jgi:hypothetical protein
VNAFDDYQQMLGVSNFSIDERDFNSIEDDMMSVVTKRSSDVKKLKGEIMWYQNIPRKLCGFVPSLISYDESTFSEYRLERINGITFNELFLSESLTDDGLVKLLDVLNVMHMSQATEDKVGIYQNYTKKLKKRYRSYDYSRFEDGESVYKKILKSLEVYQKNDQGKCGVIHGDPVFSNILLDKFGKIKLIDPRGVLGDKITIFGDIMYDYAKVYQSLLGYDEILQDKTVSEEFRTELLECFETYILDKFDKDVLSNIKTITNSLLFTLIPLHDNDKCNGYFNLIEHG